MRSVEYIIRAVGGAGDAAAVFVEGECRAYLADNGVILRGRHAEHFAALLSLGIEQVIDVEQSVIRSGYSTCNIAAAHFGPSLSVPVYPGMTPADHCMGSGISGVGELVGADKVA